MSRIALDGITLAVGEWPGPREADTDKTVICVHGLSANHTCWESVAGVLSPEYRVIAYDLRGRDDRDKPDTGDRLEAQGDDLAHPRSGGRGGTFPRGHDRADLRGQAP